MRFLILTLGLASILTTSLFGEDQQNPSKYGLYCTDAQVNKILPKNFKVSGDTVANTWVYSPSDIKNDKKAKIVEVWITSFMTQKGNLDAQQNGVGDVGYIKVLNRYDYANNKEKRLRAAFYTCDGNLIITGNERDWEYTIPGSVSDGTIKAIIGNK